VSTAAAVRRAPAHPARRQAAGLLAWWLLLTGFVLLVGKALTGPLKGAVTTEDNAVPRWFAAHRSLPWTDAAQGATLLGDTFTALGVAVALMLLLWLWLRQVRPVVFLAVVGLGELATYVVTVNLVLRPRPPVKRLDPGLNPLHSYPSGHVAGAMATYGGLAVLLWVLRRRWRRWWAPLLFVLVGLIAVARLYLGVHHPSDVLVSVLFMAVWLSRCAGVILEPAPADAVPVGSGSDRFGRVSSG
jgi:undecaprenyl-diphosphatase